MSIKFQIESNNMTYSNPIAEEAWLVDSEEKWRDRIFFRIRLK